MILSQSSKKLFKNSYSFENRLQESTRIMEKYPNRIPVIIEKSPRTDISEIDRKKFLVPNDIQLSQLMYIIRKRIKIGSEKSIYLFINEKICNATQLILEIYDKNKDDDGFLYILYAGENTFG